MSQRTLRERALQTLCFEAIGIACVTPLFMSLYGGHASESLMLMIAISVIVMIWAPLYGLMFDRVEALHTDRVASARPHGLRLVHAVLYELTAVTMTLPVAMWLGGLTVSQAIGLNIWLTLFYIAYAYLFFLVYDRMRPVGDTQAVTLCQPA